MHNNAELLRMGTASVGSAMAELERALSSPAGKAEVWVKEVANRLDELYEVGTSGLEALETSDGIYADMISDAPRLARQVEQLVASRPKLSSQLHQLRRRLGELEPAEVLEEVDTVRHDGLELLGGVARYRQRLSDLAYEAYFVDLGGAG